MAVNWLQISIGTVFDYCLVYLKKENSTITKT